MEERKRRFVRCWENRIYGNKSYWSIQWKQHGGDGVIRVDGHPIKYREDTTGRVVEIFAGVEPHAPCFVLDLDLEDKTALLQNVYKRKNCFEDGHNNSRDTVRAAYKLARERGMRLLYFRDLSYKNCPEERPMTVRQRSATEFCLADLSFLTTGKTWYESILPAVCVNCPDIELYRQKVRTNTWNTVGADLILIDAPGVDFDAPGSAMVILNAMKKDGGFCEFFSNHMHTLLRNSGITTLTNTHWECEIPPLQQASPKRRQTMSQHRTTSIRQTQRRRGGGGPSKRRK